MGRLSAAVVALAAIAGQAAAEPPASPAAPRGFAIAPPMVREGAAGAEVHGRVCRTSPVVVAGPGAIRIERTDAAGAVVDVRYARLSRALTGRETGCAVYDLATDWRLTGGESVRVSAGPQG